MKTVGDILSKARLEKNLTLEEISQTTKIGLKYLVAIEANNFASLPAAAFTKGFLQNYAKTVEVDPATVLAVFRRDYDSDERGRIVLRGLEKPVSQKLNLFTPQTITIAVTATIAVIIATFFIRQVIEFNSAPPLTITSPQAFSQLNSPITITGKTHPESSLTINNDPVSIDPNGNFTKTLELSSGDHAVIVISTSRSGKSNAQKLDLKILPPISSP